MKSFLVVTLVTLTGLLILVAAHFWLASARNGVAKDYPFVSFTESSTSPNTIWSLLPSSTVQTPVVTLSPTVTPSQSGASPIGFASLGKGTSGGSPTNVCHVKTLTQKDLIACATSPDSSTVVFDTPGTITLTNPINVTSNKTIVGPVTITSQKDIFIIRGQSNIIIKNIHLETAPGYIAVYNITCPDTSTIQTNNLSAGSLSPCGIPILILGGATSSSQNIWIDHDTFTHCGDKCIAIGNGNSPINPSTGRYNGGDLITISNSIFQNSYFAVLAAASGDARNGTGGEEVKPIERVTLYGNLFTNVLRRSPRVAQGTLIWGHEFNNVIQYWGRSTTCLVYGYGFGPSSNESAQLLVENNYIRAWPEATGCKEADDVTDSNKSAPGYIRATGNLTVNGATTAEYQPGMVFDPHQYYSYTPLPASEVYASVMANAGVEN